MVTTNGRVHRGDYLPVVLGLLGIVAIGMAAATLGGVTAPGASDNPFFEGDFEDKGPFEDRNPDPPDPPEERFGDGSEMGIGISLSHCVSFLASAAGAGLVALGFLGLVGGLMYRYNFSAALLGGWTTLPPVLLVYFLLTNCGGGGGGGPSGDNPIPNPGTGVAPPALPAWAYGVIVGGALAVGAGVLYWTRSDDAVVAVVEDDEGDAEADLDAFADAAGRAADRIEAHDAAVDNAVYRAWLEMTDHLDVEDRPSYTPADFAEEAVARGMDPDDVGELRDLFREVRYGGRDAAAREERAIEVLRRIESAYGE